MGKAVKEIGDAAKKLDAEQRKQRKRFLAAVRHQIEPRSRAVMACGLAQALVLLSLLSLALDSTLFGIEIFDGYQREIWASNDVCTELRGAITARPFSAYAQRDYETVRNVTQLYEWLRGDTRWDPSPTPHGTPPPSTSRGSAAR